MAGRQLKIEIIGDSRDLERALGRSERSLKRFAGVAAAAFGGVGFTKILTDSVKAASNLQESLSKSNVVFGTSAAAIEAWSKTTATAFGLSQRAALETASSFGALFGPLGITGRQAADTSRRLVELGADLASFYNTDVASALDAIKSGLVGEAEPLRRYGALLSETKVQAKAMADTGKNVAASLTDQEKVLARVELLFEQTTVAQGDAARTGDQFAGQMKKLQAQLEDLQATIGAELLPHVTELVTQFNKWLENPENKQRIIEGFATGVDHLASAFNAAADAVGFFKSAWDKLPDFGKDKGLMQLIDENLPGGDQSLLEMLGLSPQAWLPGHRPGGAEPPRAPSAWRNWQEFIKGLIPTEQLAGGQGISGGARAGQFLQPDAFSGPILKFLDKYKQMNDRILAAQKAADAYQTRMETKRGWLDFGLERAESTKKLSDDRLWLRKIEAYLQERIRHEDRKLELVQDLWRTRQKIRDLNKKQADVDPLAGLMQVSSRRMANMLAAGTGLDLAGRRVLGANIAGMEMRPVYVAVHIDGREVGRAVAKDQARTSRRTARQTSGYRG